MLQTSKIFTTGDRGLVGYVLVKKLHKKGFLNLVFKTRSELDFTDNTSGEAFFDNKRPGHILLAIVKTGGIHENNKYSSEFIFSNMHVLIRVIKEAWKFITRILLHLVSSCIYPNYTPQPMLRNALLSGLLEPTNLYGPINNFNPYNSISLPAPTRRFHEAIVNNASKLINFVYGQSSTRPPLL